MVSAFQKVRNTFISDTKGNLERLGVEVKLQNGDWLSVKCPFCPDKSGSCSVSVQTGHLKCHQCQENGDLFTWYAHFQKCANSWDACKNLAAELKVEVTPRKRRAPPRSRGLDSGLLEKIEHDLWEDEDAEPVRQFLAERGLKDPATASELHLGYLDGELIFPQFEPSGLLRSRARRYAIGSGTKTKWRWLGGEGSAAGLWPCWMPPDDAGVIWLCEGEWDTIAARYVLDLPDQGIYPYCWTSPMAGLHPDKLPKWMHEREVHIVYDNDTFQKPSVEDQVAPSEKHARSMRQRREGLMKRVAQPLARRLKCNVTLRAIPIDPVQHWGADLRDWIEAGNRNIDDIPGWRYEEVVDAKRSAAKVSFSEAYQLARRDVKFLAIVDGVNQEGTVIPKVSKLICRMGEIKSCDNCLAPDRFPDGIIDWSEYPDELARVVCARNPERETLTNVVGKPNACNFAQVSTEEYQDGCNWLAADAAPEKFSQRALVVISRNVPSLSSEVEVSGTVRHLHNTVMVMANKVRDIEAGTVDLKEFTYELMEKCPHQTDDANEIEVCFRERAADLSANVTKVYGRDDLHTAVDLVAHSALWMNSNGRRRRAWLDATIIGDTRTGKTVVAREMLQHYGVGRFVSCLENISRAGLTMGMAADRGGMHLRPGLFPRSHQRMLVLDEFHYMVDEKSGDSPMRHLQAARDIGEVMGVKIYGTHSLKAAVRLLTIANWARDKRATYRFPCEHMLYLYGSPESVARTDFGLTIARGANSQPHQHGKVWHNKISQALVLRAWAMRENDIIITDKATELAEGICRDWAKIYAEDLPLFTRGEKVFSLLRIAVAVANSTFSHPKGHEEKCEVRPCHVEWAAEWVQYTWKLSKYLHYSLNAPSRRQVSRPFEAEAQLTVWLNLADSEDAANILEHLLGQSQRSHLSSVLGKEPHEIDKWSRLLMGCGVLHSAKAANGYNTVIQPTVAGHQVLTNLLDLAENFPAAWVERYQRMKAWQHDRVANPSKKPDLLPITADISELREAWGTIVDEGPIEGLWNGATGDAHP